ncbi:MAG: hypothetical protein ACYDEX_20190 [Mobilitalea sp.]
MYNESIYNVIIAPHIEDKLFRKRSVFTTWIWAGIVFLLFDLGYSAYDFIYKNDELRWVNTAISIMGILFVFWGVYVIFYNPLRKYHISLQIYFYLLFMDYFYFNKNKYPNGIGKKMQYVVIVQTCIDSINKYIKMMETLLINGDNTIARIDYLRALRDLLYKMKGEVFFKNQITSFRGVLDNFYSSIHIGIKAVLDFGENVEYFECNNFRIMTQECSDILKQKDDFLNKNKVQKEDKDAGIRRKILIVFTISSIIIITNIMIPYKLLNPIITSISVLANLITVFVIFKR